MASPSKATKTKTAVGAGGLSVSLSLFDTEYAKLNPDQRKAVDTVEGPVMVVAGPGTGKTQTVAMRVANILRKTQARPGSVLCLTFSTSGATAMRERLRLLIGADAYGVTVSTIHKFCQDIITDHPALFDEWSALEQISDLERFRELNKIIDQLLPDLVLLNPKCPYVRTKELIARISDVKREGKTVEDLRQAAEEYATVMEGKSKPGTKAHEKNLLSARKFREFVEIFDRYRQMLRLTGRYDYDDMILFVIRALEREEWLLAQLQERYLYVLVDEFQDTNGAQYRVIDLLTKPVTPEDRPNLFVVGDDDQAIYRFQGANLQNILRFRERFPDAAVVSLTTSYRSTQAILDAASRLIARNTERLVGRIDGLRKELRAASGEQGNVPVLLRPPSDMAEPWMIVDIVRDHLDAGLKPSDIAVIVQTNRELRPYYDVLTGKGIPVRITGKRDLLEHPLVLQLVAILRAIHKPDTSARYAGALGAECLGIHPADVAHLCRLHRERKQPLRDVLGSLDQSDAPDVRFADKDRLVRTRDLLDDLHQKLPTRTVVETIERVLHDCGLLAKGREIHPLDLAALQSFFDRAKERMIEVPGVTFELFMADLELYANPDYGLRMTYDIPHLVTEGVQLMTAHQSKGMEFAVVILANFREGLWDKHRKPGGISLPEDLLFGWEKEQKAFEKNQDERRVAFVAMTRAERELILSCPKELTAGDKTKSVSPSAFVAEAGPLPEEERGIDDPEHASTLLLNPAPAFDAQMRDFLTERLQTFALSASGLNRFLEDPVEFLRIDLLQVPQLSEYARAYGNAAHWALRQWGLAMQRGMPIGKEAFLGYFQNFLQEREFLADNEMKLLLHLGQEALPRYFDQRLAASAPFIDQVEKMFITRLGDIPVKGNVDRIDRDHPESASGTVIDYKTGRPQSENQIREGDYYRQLQFYAVLLEEAYPSLTPKAFILEFIGDREEHPVSRIFQITSEEKKAMRELIAKVWGKIVNLDFTPLLL
ncbi:MAG: ATP-dependent DNA helicase [Candidatus Peribacteraceae bacterium]|nr:ATP-dependent DNA helicase [Candidatus Peribacteraceae bacterium]